jgi:hypothetical protein
MDTIEISIELLEQASSPGRHVQGMEVLDGKLLVWARDHEDMPPGTYEPSRYELRPSVPHGTEGRHVVVMRKVR